MRLFEQLLKIQKENLTSFHVPGHKGHKEIESYYNQLESILSLDLTEFPGTDDLHDPETVILNSQKFASKLYGSKESFFLVNGTTCGIYAMMMAVTKPGDKVIVARDCHRAVYDGLLLGHLKASFIKPLIECQTSIPLGITTDALEECILENRDAKAIVLTYPNYYGVACDLESIVTLAHAHKMLVLVDGAHAAHLILSEDLPKSAIACGADLVVHSSHKSLPVFTQASMLHLNSDLISRDKLRDMISLHQSSSPSYLLMASLDIGMDYISRNGHEKMKILLENIERLHHQYDVFLKEEDLLNLPFTLDKTKMVLKGLVADINPMDLDENIRKNGIQLEFSTENIALFVTSIMNEVADFQYLFKTMEMLNFKCYSGIDNIAYALNLDCKMTICEAYYSNKEKLLLDDSIGRISGDFIVPYPPGVPLIIPGEVISKEVISVLKRMKENNQKIVGMTNIEFEDLKIQVVIN